MDVSGEGFGCLNFIAPKLTPWTTSQTSLDTIWDNAEDEVYAQLLLNS